MRANEVMQGIREANLSYEAARAAREFHANSYMLREASLAREVQRGLDAFCSVHGIGSLTFQQSLQSTLQAQIRAVRPTSVLQLGRVRRGRSIADDITQALRNRPPVYESAVTALQRSVQASLQLTFRQYYSDLQRLQPKTTSLAPWV